MSDIDFAEIEKAMAELVNKAQGKERQQGLGQVAKHRSKVAKDTETARDQGDIATKRIIVASKNIRNNPHPAPGPSPQYSTLTPGRVMDFVPPSPTPVLPREPQVIQTPTEDSELQKTVGELSNEYLTEQVRDSDLGSDEELDRPFEEPEQPEGDLEEQQDEDLHTSLEDLTGPSPVMSFAQEPTLSGVSSSVNREEDKYEDNLPEASDLAEDVGKVHKIYGQKLPKEYLKKQNKKRDFSTKTKVKSGKAKKGFAFYFVLLMILASVVVWGAAAYLYFVR